MNIILVSNSMAKAKTLSTWQVCMIVLGIAIIPAMLLFVLILPQQPDVQSHVKHLIPAQLQFSFNNPQKHLDAYAIQIGELQARIVLLDAQSQRLEKLAETKQKANVTLDATITDIETQTPLQATDSVTTIDIVAKQDNQEAYASDRSPVVPSQHGSADNSDKVVHDKTSLWPTKLNYGGPLVRSSPVTESDLQAQIAALTNSIEMRHESLSTLEVALLQQTVLKALLPNSSPVHVAFNSSSYGWRYDPFNGNRAFHEGLDFTAATGTPIYAAAGGIVTYAGHTNDYGRLVKLEHGAGLETRYAHASKLLVKNGERVEKGQKIAEVGSTGRSTGPHLHYEIRLNGSSLDPKKYLNAFQQTHRAQQGNK